eukprot:360479-Chlamydomonas_euryale.AAC.6
MPLAASVKVLTPKAGSAIIGHTRARCRRKSIHDDRETVKCDSTRVFPCTMAQPTRQQWKWRCGAKTAARGRCMLAS